MIAAVKIACFYPNVARSPMTTRTKTLPATRKVMQEELKRYRASPDRILLQPKLCLYGVRGTGYGHRA